MDGPVENLSKIQVASRQVAEAIRMFFKRRDPLAIHTIVHAAHQILSDICRAKGIDTIIKNNPSLKPGMVSEWNAAMNKAGNFLKHADCDPNEVLEFQPRLTQGFIFDCVHMTHAVSGHLPIEHQVFLMWFNITHPDLLQAGPMKTAIDEALKSGLDPHDFDLLSEFLEIRSNAA